MISLNENTAVVHEIFSAIQGEGLLVGYRQLLLRFHGCNLNCAYCDTPASKQAVPEFCRVENYPGQREMSLMANPLSTGDILSAVKQLQTGFSHHSVSFTGGEPLIHADMLAVLITPLQREGLPVYLETNGTLWKQLALLPEAPYYIAMDIKLPSSAGGEFDNWEEHAQFLANALCRYELPAEHIQVKIVFGEESLDDIARAVSLVADADTEIPVILQPLTVGTTSANANLRAPRPETVLAAQHIAAQKLPVVRVIPQTHVILQQW